MECKKFVIDRGFNDLAFFCDGKYHDMRVKTVFQFEQFQKWAEKTRAENTDNKEQTAFESMTDNNEVFLDWLVIALNPVPGEQKWPREKIEEKFDLDKRQLLATIWHRRFISPQIEQDPLLAP